MILGSYFIPIFSTSSTSNVIFKFNFLSFIALNLISIFASIVGANSPDVFIT